MKPASATSRSFTEITARIRQHAIGAQPTLIAEAEYTAWTDDGKLQLAAHKGWGKCGTAPGSMSPPRLSRGSERRDPQPHPTVEIAWTFMSSRTS